MKRAIGCVAVVILALVLGAGAARSWAQHATNSSGTATVATPVQPTPVAGRLVLTYYFYWYDSVSGGHLQDSVLHQHFPASPPPSWRSVEWQQRQLADMAGAGIDVTLPVYWGFDRPQDDWSWKGLDVLAQAWNGMQAKGVRPPRVGMFLDSTIVNHRDLTSPDGEAWFYANFRDFFTRIPRAAWALVDGRPIAFLFTSDWTDAMNQATFDYVYNHFQADFGVRPYIVREVSWDYPILRWSDGKRILDTAHPIRTDNNYLWGAAVHGYVDRGGVAAVGPGFDDRGLPGRTGTIRDRADGKFYADNFRKAIASGRALVAIETWDELHEASGICDTTEFGSRYLQLTRVLTDTFHSSG